MPQPHNPAANQDLIEGVLYPALDSSKGLALDFLTPGEAISLRFRVFAAIKMLRRQSMEVLPETHPRYGKSDFDSLVIQTAGCSLFVRKASPDDIESRLNASIREIL